MTDPAPPTPTASEEPAAEDDRPISVRLGTVVPPEDPEDWRRPLTWVAAAGMLLGPLVALAWFMVTPPQTTLEPVLGTWLLAAALVVGAVATGSTQLQAAWSFAATLGAGLFAALLTVIIGFALSNEATAGVAAPPVAHAVLASVAGLAGALASATLMPLLARGRSRSRRGLVPGILGVAVALLIVQLVFNA
jgi:hypothetical protein